MIILIYIKNVTVIIIVYVGNEHKEFCEKIIKLYFNIEHRKFFYLLQKEIKLNKNIRNINVLIDLFMNLYDNSNIDCNKKIEINYVICIIIFFLINSFIVINIKIIFYLVIINRSFYHVRSSVVLDTSVFRVLLSNKIVGKGWVKST